MIGYASPAYAQSLAEFGRPRRLPRSGSHLLCRQIPGTTQLDGMAPYPILSCGNWDGLADDLADLRAELVSVSAVTDPLAPVCEDSLRRTFDVVRHFKDHLLTDLSADVRTIVSPHHRYYGRRAMKSLDVFASDRPLDHLDGWADLYGVLNRRHRVTGIRAFSRTAFANLLAMEELVLIVAAHSGGGGAAVAMQCWIVQGDTAYSHLTACSEEGYRLRATYALYLFAVEHFKQSVARDHPVRCLDLGAGAGLAAEDSGLTAFKRGWSTHTRPAYLCGKVLQPEAYRELAERCGNGNSVPDGFFPAYRRGFD